MSWTHHYDDEADKTTIRYDDDDLGTVDGRLTSFSAGMPTGEAREIIKEAVDDPMVIDLLYGFSEDDE